MYRSNFEENNAVENSEKIDQLVEWLRMMMS